MARPIIELSGKTFGSIEVIKLDYKDNQGTHWLCNCKCGRSESFSVLGKHLRRGECTQCKKCRYENMEKRRSKDIKIGKVFGMLTVVKEGEIYVSPNGNRSRRFYVICSCRPEVQFMVRGSALISGQKSCGCLKDSKIAFELKKYFKINYDAETEYKVLKNTETGFWLPYDIYIPHGENPDLNGFYIEIHGEQHYTRNSSWDSLEKFNYRKKLDKTKKKFAKKNGVYIEVDLRKIKIVEDAIKEIEKIIVLYKTGE